MAEALAIVGLVSAIVQFVDFGSKVVKRLNEFSTDIDELPKTFRNIRVQLPLLVDTLGRTQRQAELGHISEVTANALKPIIVACLDEIKVLQTTLDKALPPRNSSSWQRRFHVLRSLAHDKDVDRSVKNLESHIQSLTFHQTTSNSDQLLTLRVLPQAQDVTPPQPRSAVFMVPFDRDDDFIGRQDILDSIDHKLNAPRRRAVLTGIGGVGKSRIAIQYCYKYRSAQPNSHVFWIHCGSVARIDQGYKEIAHQLKLPGLQDPGIDILKTVFAWLSDDDNGTWLLVLDNADDQDMFFGSSGQSKSQDVLQNQLGRLAQYLPRSAYGSTLITTRDQRAGQRFAERERPIIVLPLGPEDATVMLRSRLPDDLGWNAAEACELLESLQNLPLAIAQAASYITEEDVTLARYLELLRPGNDDSKALLEQDYHDSRRHADIHNSVFQTWKLSFDLIRRQIPRAAEILSLMCVLDRQSITRGLLEDEGESQVVLDKAFATLKNFSLIHEEKSNQTYEIHRLVQLCIQWWLEQEQSLKKWQEKALVVLLRACPPSEEVEHWKAWAMIIPHIIILQGYQFEGEEEQLDYADLISWTSRYNLELGRYEVALKMQEEGLMIRQKFLGKEHESTLQSMNDLALILHKRGRYKQAEEMNRETLKLRETILGKEHLSTLTSMNNLALALSYQGKYEQAEEIHRQVLQLRETVLGKEHRRTLTSMNNLALVLGEQEKYEQAEEIHRQVIQLHETVLGKEHPSTLTSMNNLASVLGAQGKYEEGEKNLRHVVGLKGRVIGKEHPDTLKSVWLLADILRCQERFDEATPLFQRALAGFEKTLGSEHPNTQTCHEQYLSMLKDIDQLNTVGLEANLDNISETASDSSWETIDET